MSAQKRRLLWGNSPKFKVPKTFDGPSTSTNRFHILYEEEEEAVAIKEKIPPIIVDSAHSFSTVVGIIGDKYSYKRMSIGTKILSNSLSLYNDALNTLKERKFQFTHELKFGLPKLDSNVIGDEFVSSHNIKPVSVKELETKRSTVDDAIYLIEFDRQHVSKREIMKIRYFSNIAVYWRKPLKGNKGPTQCAKCAMYGHGAKNCNLCRKPRLCSMFP
ncbi:uncharacterized protein LOC135950485 [Calliphora vicina]|uniref:uncharacterized protein LOC135950485 n=1 Tax=Calliphora vicina TaxID=7373 RepID=UPI00325B81F3